MPIETYFKDIADAIREKGGTSALITPGNMPQAILDLPSGGGSFITQTEWDALTFTEKQARGLSLIGTQESISGTYYNYSVIDVLWRFSATPLVVDIFDGTGFNFHGFYSNTIGDRVTAGGRGGTRTAGDMVFICNGYWNGNTYGAFLMFGLSPEALAASNTSFYGIKQVSNFTNLYVSGNLNGGWGGNADVTLVHESATYTLQSLFSLENYTLRTFSETSAGYLTFTENNNFLLNAIKEFLMANT